MLQQLGMLIDAMHRGYHTLDTFRVGGGGRTELPRGFPKAQAKDGGLVSIAFGGSDPGEAPLEVLPNVSSCTFAEIVNDRLTVG
ncbi:hypothetical protein BAE44_0020568 [Dichanthelium oligosanthes]|uniref:Uncharacterized protein n=1 Tax=Dichanthelium oligosanthes TaxID=888268 RepID=A0A1E5UZV6_9POAL|nr:hypothetical protein BAE44_0020568 [Dichanthelium oligosanthes]